MINGSSSEEVLPGDSWHNELLLTSESFDITDRMFSTGPVRLPGVQNIEGYDYAAVIAKARSLPELPP